MRCFMGIVGAMIWLAVPAVLQAGDRDKALAVIDKAIEAHGGTSALDKAQMRSRSGQGVFSLRGDARFSTEETVRFPDRCRVLLNPKRDRVILVLNGDKGWIQAGGATQEMARTALKEKQEELYVWWLMTLTPLRKDEFRLKLLADAKVNDRDAAVVLVSRKDSPDARLFFDKRSGLLVKIARPATESGLPITKEYVYSDHKEFDGVKMPTKEVITLNGTAKYSEVKFSDYKVLSRAEDKLFEKP
ncbi:MAG TPA: hypothetical protein VMG10_06000 [Gemmataceae bacterium]|nr:hypothetical protein [Gemmataceae bacterium]